MATKTKKVNRRAELRKIRIRLQLLALRIEQDEDTGDLSVAVVVDAMNLARDLQQWNHRP